MLPNTILVIDDQWSMQELARIVLRTAGYRVLLAGDLVTGLCLARTEHPDLVVVDKQLMPPGDAGLQQNLQLDPKTAAIPLIIITACPGEDAGAGPLSSGTMARLHKPFHPRELLLLVDRILQHKGLPIAV